MLAPTTSEIRAKLLETVERRVDAQMAGRAATAVATLVADGMTVAEIRANLIARTMHALEGQLS